MALCYEIQCTKNKNCFEETNVDVVANFQTAQPPLINFKSTSTVL